MWQMTANSNIFAQTGYDETLPSDIDKHSFFDFFSVM
jgi:hypothetical protein